MANGPVPLQRHPDQAERGTVCRHTGNAPYVLRKLVKAIYIEALDKSSGKKFL